METVAAAELVINYALFLLLRPAEIVPKDGPGVKPRLAPPPVVIPRQLSHLIDQSNCHAVIVHHQIDPLTGLRGICHCPMPINHTCCNFETNMQNLFVKPNGSDPLPLSSPSALATRFYRAAKKKDTTFIHGESLREQVLSKRCSFGYKIFYGTDRIASHSPAPTLVLHQPPHSGAPCRDL